MSMQEALLSFSNDQTTAFHRNEHNSANESACLVEETPIAISINGIAHAVMMITPTNIEDFVLGFALSEGIIQHNKDVRDLNFVAHNTNLQSAETSLEVSTIAADLEISSRQFNVFKQHKRSHLGTTGCGLCGIESLDQAIPALPPLTPSQRPQTSQLLTLRERLTKEQKQGQKTGAIHAALLLSPDNDILCCMEDIGRHNALDKVIGYALRHNIILHNHNVVMSSRCSTELVQKAVRVGLSHLTHLASPSALAVKLAQHYGLTLIHLPKHDAPRIFASATANKKPNHPLD